ncbi:MAG: DUF2059 domain-containing protein, partial [Xanthobacteraceae bacterium]
MRVWTGAVVAAAILTTAARAQAPSPSPETLAAAHELVVVMKADNQLRTLLPLILQRLKPAIVQGRPEVERDYDTLAPMMTTQANSRSAEFVEAISITYARNFSAAELHELTAFCNTPTGQKVLERLPALTQQSLVVGQQFGQALLNDLRPRIIDELRK